MTYILVKTVTIVVTTTVSDSTICVYTLDFGGSSQHVASLYTVMLLLELIRGVTRPSTDINNNIKNTDNADTTNYSYYVSIHVLIKRSIPLNKD